MQSSFTTRNFPTNEKTMEPIDYVRTTKFHEIGNTPRLKNKEFFHVVAKYKDASWVKIDSIYEKLREEANSLVCHWVSEFEVISLDKLKTGISNVKNIAFDEAMEQFSIRDKSAEGSWQEWKSDQKFKENQRLCLLCELIKFRLDDILRNMEREGYLEKRGKGRGSITYYYK
jgi:hypothetical protein